MIKTVQVKNFQSHKDTELNLVDGVNIILGQSTSGKTAILRAINWLINNRPLGFRFHSRFARKKDPTEVVLELEGTVAAGDTFIILNKDGGGSTYTVGTEVHGAIDEFKGIGSSVPDSVTSLINMSEINFQEQLDEHFLITSPPGKVAKVFNKIIKVEQVDSWISKLTTKINSLNKSQTFLSEQIVSNTNSLELYKDLPQMEKYVADYESVLQKVEVLSKDIASVDELVEDSRRYKNLIDACIDLRSLEELIGKLQETSTDFNRVYTGLKLVSECIMMYEEISLLDEDIKDLSGVLSNVDTMLTSYNALREDIDAVRLYTNNIKIMKESLLDMNAAVSKKQEEFSEYLKEVKVCPVCLTPLKASKIKELVDK